MKNLCKRYSYILLLVHVILFLSAFNVLADGAWYTDVPAYDQEWFNGCSGDCGPTAGAMVLGWYDSHDWPRMVHGGSNDHEKNPLGVLDLGHDLSATMEFQCNIGTYTSKIGPGIEASSTNMDPGANFDTNSDDWVWYSQLKNCINDHGPLVFFSVAEMTYYYIGDSSSSLDENHFMTMIGYDDGGTHYSVSSRWIKLNMGWGDYKTPGWVDFDNSGSNDFYDTRVYSGGTPSGDDDDSYEDNDFFEDAKLISTGSYTTLKCNDEDFFRFYVSSNKNITVTITFTHSNGDLDLYLYNSSASLLDSSTGTGNTETVEYLTSSSGYYYVKIKGYLSAKNTYSMTILTAGTAPSPPTGVSATDGTYTDKVRVTWDSVSDATSYKVYRATSSGGTKTYLGSASGTSYDDTSASLGTTYYYWVEASNSYGSSGYSSYDTGWRKDITPPLAPIDLNADPSSWTKDNSFSINWTNPNDFSGIAGAYYKRGSAPTSNSDYHEYKTSKPFPVSTSSEDGQKLYVWLKDNAGNKDYNNYSYTWLYYDGTKPKNPTSCIETHGATDDTWQNTINDPKFTWSGASDSHSGIKGYYWYFGTDSNGDPTTWTDSAGCDPGPVESGSYYLIVKTEDNAGNISDPTTLFIFKYDDIKPTNPTSCTESHGAPNDTWQKDVDDPEFIWSGHSDGTGSGVHGFYVYWGSNPNGTSSDYTTTARHDPPSVDSGTYYLRVSTKDNVDWTADWETIFTFRYDDTIPTDPTTVNSTSHSKETWSNDPTIEMQWSGASDTHSGVHGYSYEFSQSEDTIPDTTVDTQDTNGTSPSLSDGNNWYFHIRTRDNAGNWTSTVHTGPYYIDTTAPTNPTSCTETHGAVKDTWQNEVNDPTFTWSGAADSHSGVKGYYWYFGTDSNGNPTTWTDSAGCDPSSVGNGTYYLRIKTKDNVGKISIAETIFTFKYDSTKPTDPTTVWSTSHTKETWSNDPTIEMEWSGASDTHSGVHGYSYEFSQSDNTIPDTTVDTQDTNATSPSLSDGDNWYFHIRTRDNAGNWTSTVHEGPYYIDSAKPTKPIISSTTHPDKDIWYQNNGPNFSWSSSDSGGSEIKEYCYSIDNPNPDDCSTDISKQYENIEDGEHTFYVVSKDNAGNISEIASYQFKIDTTNPTNPTSCTVSLGAVKATWQNEVNDPTFTWSGAADSHSGVKGYYWYFGTDSNGNPTNWTASAGCDPGSVESGTYYLIVRTEDNASNISDPTTLFTFKYDGTPPIEGTISINNGAPKTSSLIVKLNDLGATEPLSGLDKMRFSNDGTTWSQEESYSGSKTGWDLSAYGGNITPGLKTVHVQYKDIAGNWSDSCSDMIEYYAADLSVIKADDHDPIAPGDQLTYTITVKNNPPGSYNAENVALTDNVPSQIQSPEYSTDDGENWNQWAGSLELGTLGAEDSKHVLIRGTIDSSAKGIILNEASVSSSTTDPDTSNNSDVEDTIVSFGADLKIQETVDNITPNVGDQVVLTITVTNNGPNDAIDVEVTDILPYGLWYVSDDSGGGYEPDIGIWNIGNLSATPPDNTTSLTISATVEQAGDILNIASITDSGEIDPDSSNNSSALTLNGGIQADLSIVKTVDNPSPNAGDTISFTIRVTNNGLDNATGLEVTDVLPTGLTYQSCVSTQGSYDTASGIWDIDALNLGESATLQVTAIVNSTDEIINTARITHSDQIDPDKTNNDSSKVINQDIGGHPSIVDLAVQKTVNQSEVNVEDEVVFTVLVRNNGPDDANGIKVDDILPDGLSFVSSEQSLGTYDKASGIWTVGAIAASAYVLMDIVTEITDTGSHTNIANVSNVDEFDLDDSNNSDEATVKGYGTDISVSKTTDKEEPRVGDTIVFTINVKNEGTRDATDVQVTDQLPQGLKYQSSTSTQGTYNSDTGVWNVGYLTEKASITLNITAKIEQSGDITNTAKITASRPVDLNADNDIGNVALSIPSDGDDDGIPDEWEVAYGLDPWVDDSLQDPDGDYLINFTEYQNRTNPNIFDTDGDGMSDGWEVSYGLKPLVNDASEDLDEDGYSNLEEYNACTNPNAYTDTLRPDKPILASPNDGASGISLIPELTTEAFSDPDSYDTHALTEWQISTEDDFSLLVLDITSDSHLTSLTVPHSVMQEDTTYYWRVCFYDNHLAVSEWSDTNSFTTKFTGEDPDIDGIPDNQEVDNQVDLDGNGTPDIEQNDIKDIKTIVGDGIIGLSIRDSDAVRAIEWIKSIDPATISDTGGRPEKMPLGLISFRLNLYNPGDEVEVTVYLSEPAPSDAIWYKYDSVKGWQDYSEHAVFSVDRKSVTLKLKDGGFGDVDGTANGIIVDPSGYGSGNQTPKAKFTASPTWGYIPMNVSFNASDSYDPDGTMESYSWDFGDGSTGSGESTSHEYTASGTYKVTLLVTDDNGAEDTTSATITAMVMVQRYDDIGRCFIATTAYESPKARQVKVLREFRDRFLVNNSLGRAFVSFYNNHSQILADFIANHATIRVIVRWSLLPVVVMSWMALHYGMWLTLTLAVMLLCLMGAGAAIIARRIRLRQQA